jgi:hypothetical protein
MIDGSGQKIALGDYVKTKSTKSSYVARIINTFENPSIVEIRFVDNNGCATVYATQIQKLSTEEIVLLMFEDRFEMEI